MENKRIKELDILRGICVFMMCIDHFMLDLASNSIVSYIVKYPFNDFTYQLTQIGAFYMFHPARKIIRYIFLFFFFALVGINNTLSKNNFKRGYKLFSWAIALTTFTLVLSLITDDPNNLITFGVLHAISCSILIYSFISKYVDNKYFYLVVGILLCCLAYYNSNIKNGGMIGLSYYNSDIFEIVYKQMVGEAMFGLDTFSLLSVLGQSFIGVFIGKSLYVKKESLIKKDFNEKVFTFLSKHSLFAYFASQLIFVIIMVVYCLIGGSKFII